jgi:hypothetical protein
LPSHLPTGCPVDQFQHFVRPFEPLLSTGVHVGLWDAALHVQALTACNGASVDLLQVDWAAWKRAKDLRSHLGSLQLLVQGHCC